MSRFAAHACPRIALLLLKVLAGCRQSAPHTNTMPTAAMRNTGPTPTAGTAAIDPVDASAPNVDTRPIALAHLVPVNDADAGPAAPTGLVPDCEEKLRAAGVTFHSAQLLVHRQGHATCGAPQVVNYVRGPGNITYEPAPLLTCAMALALASFEPILQQEASRVFRSTVVRVQQIGTYNCREILAVKGLASEHSYANAIDLTGFVFANGKTVTVLSDFDKGEGPPARAGGDFLRAISVRAYREGIFPNLLTPFWDPAHKNHFHLDLARYEVDGVEPRRR